MKNKSKLDNSLIKKKSLLKNIHKEDIRINKDALKYLDKLLNENIIQVIEMLSRIMMTNGKKTIEIKDIKKVFEKINKNRGMGEIFEI